ncbi:MAG: DUF2905 family protein [Geminicoccaceae bacterium]
MIHVIARRLASDVLIDRGCFKIYAPTPSSILIRIGLSLIFQVMSS